jgi:WD40 repeat protein
MAYSTEHRILVTAGSDRDALVWNPIVKSRPIFRLKGHHTSLIGVDILEGTPQIITADVDGFFKLWDIRTFECIQTFAGHRETEDQIHAFTSTCSHNQIIAGGTISHLYQYNKPGIPWQTMEEPIIQSIYLEKSASIITVGGDVIKVCFFYLFLLF